MTAFQTLPAIVLSALLLLTPPTPAAAGTTARAPEGSAFFWDRYERALILSKTAPDSARALARRLLLRDPDDLVARCLRMRGLRNSGADSLEAADLLDRAARLPDSAGLQVAAGIWNFRGGRTEAGRQALERAGTAYEARGRVSDASHAWMLAYHYSRGAGPAAQLAADLERALRLAREAGDAAAEADALMLRAVEESRRDSRRSLATRQEALRLLEPLGSSFQLIECHRALANNLKTLGRPNESRPHYETALRLARARAFVEQEIRCLAGLANVERAAGAYDRALSLFRRARALALSYGDENILADREAELGSVYLELGRCREARERLEAGLAPYRRGRAPDSDTVIAIDQLAALEAKTGRHEEARRLWEEAVDVCRRRGYRNRLPFILAHLSSFQLDLGDAVGALGTADEGLATAREVAHERSQPTLQGARARALARLDRDDEALEAAREGERAARSVDPRQVWEMVQLQAMLLERLGRLDAAMACLDSTLARAETGGDTFQWCEALLVQAGLLTGAGAPAEALDRLARARALSAGFGDPELAARLDLAEGRALLRAGRNGEACDRLESGLHWFESCRTLLLASEDRQGFSAGWHEAYDNLALARARQSRNDEAFLALESTHARELRGLLGGDTAGLARHGPRRLVGRLAAVEAKLTLVQSQLLAARGGAPGSSELDAAGLATRADSLKREWDGLTRRLQRESAGTARALGMSAPVRAAEVRRALRPGERLLAYLVGETATLLFEFRPGELRVHELAVPADSLAARVARFIGSLRDGRDDEWRAPAAELGQLLLGPAGLAQETAATIYLVPDGVLHLLPFEALRVPGASGTTPGPLLIAEAELTYGDSVTLLLRPPNGRPARTDSDRAALAAFGDPRTGGSPSPAEEVGAPAAAAAPGTRFLKLAPLPHAREEAEQLAALIPGTEVYVGGAATESRFLHALGAHRVIHVATHAFVDEQRPAFSGLVLAPDPTTAPATGPTDGLVQAFEIMADRHDLELAVLSACETGRGRLLEGEGLIGLARAFRLAGARRLVVSLWKIDDAAAAEFMKTFYARLAHGGSVARALRAAKLEFLADADAGPGSGEAEETPRGVARRSRVRPHAHPASWAPFILFGMQEPPGAGLAPLLSPAQGRRSTSIR